MTAVQLATDDYGQANDRRNQSPKLTSRLKPQIFQEPYTFLTIPPGTPIPTAPEPFAVSREEEGVTLIAPGEGWARITLTIHSSLEAVGLTAAISNALGERGISANIVAAYYHDHVFVAWHRREEALEVLRKLGGNEL